MFVFSRIVVYVHSFKVCLKFKKCRSLNFKNPKTLAPRPSSSNKFELRNAFLCGLNSSFFGVKKFGRSKGFKTQHTIRVELKWNTSYKPSGHIVNHDRLDASLLECKCAKISSPLLTVAQYVCKKRRPNGFRMPNVCVCAH